MYHLIQRGHGHQCSLNVQFFATVMMIMTMMMVMVMMMMTIEKDTVVGAH